MLEKSDKRATERLPANVSITFSNFSTKNWHDIPSVTLNLSSGGMCFESRHSFKPGADLFIRAAQNTATVWGNGHGDLLRTSTLAEVRWCRKTTRENKTRYRIGVKYL